MIIVFFIDECLQTISAGLPTSTEELHEHTKGLLDEDVYWAHGKVCAKPGLEGAG